MLAFAMAYLLHNEIYELGLKSFGSGVLISDTARIYHPHLVSIGDKVRIDDFVVLSGKVTIGKFVHISMNSALLASDQEIILEDFSGISPGCSLFTSFDDYSGGSMTNPTVPNEFRHVLFGSIVLKRHVIVGAHSVIGPGVIIGEGAAVGALSLVNSSVPAWTINGGVPSKFLKNRKKDLLNYESKLENWSFES